MSTAVVQLKLIPADYDLVRESLQAVIDHAASLAPDAGDPKSRQAARTKAAQAAELLRKIA